MHSMNSKLGKAIIINVDYLRTQNSEHEAITINID